MTYGLSTHLFIENGPASQALRVRASYSTARSWRALNPDRRLAAIERALAPANDPIDDYATAL
jgi:hypothetical protein